jgi:hypothetical protein
VTEGVYCAVRAESLYAIRLISVFKWLNTFVVVSVKARSRGMKISKSGTAGSNLLILGLVLYGGEEDSHRVFFLGGGTYGEETTLKN